MSFLSSTQVSHWLHQQWQKRGIWAWLMSPLGLLVALIAYSRRMAYRLGWLRPIKIDVPIVVVGNIYVGGSGKTPLVLYLAYLLQKQGINVGIICSGYHGKSVNWPQSVTPESDPFLVGDEAVMLSTLSLCPVVAGPQRALAAQQLLAKTDTQIILSDDGFSHGALARDIDIVVFDVKRGIGNGWCLPAGPLRESPSAVRLAHMQVWQGKTPPLAANEYAMIINPGTIYHLHDKTHAQLEALRKTRLHAIAGIGDPQRFFDTLRSLGLDIIEHAFSDHHTYQQSDFTYQNTYDIITTEKDAVKLKSFTLANEVWVLPIKIGMNNHFDTDFLHRLKPLMSI